MRSSGAPGDPSQGPRHLADLDLGRGRRRIRALAHFSLRLGLARGDRIAIVGANRPLLYWTITAAQVLGAIPVPVYADAVAEEIANVLGHADVSLIAAQDQEQVDKIFSVADRLPR